MLDEKTIQRAHDILHFLVTPEGPGVFDEESLSNVHAAHDALAYVLGFPCGKTFAENLEVALKHIKAAGYQEVDFGKPISDVEARKRGLIA